MPDLGECDAHDLKLLAALQEDCLRTVDDLARDVPLSPSSIARRIRRLRESGIIERAVAIVAPGRAHLSAIVDVQMDHHARPQMEALIRRLSTDSRVQMLLELTGAFDLMLVVAVRDMDAFNEFADSMLADGGAVRRYETRFIKRRRKFTVALPLG